MGTIGLVCCPSYCVDLFINKHFNISRLGRTARKDCIFKNLAEVDLAPAKKKDLTGPKREVQPAAPWLIRKL